MRAARRLAGPADGARTARPAWRTGLPRGAAAEPGQIPPGAAVFGDARRTGYGSRLADVGLEDLPPGIDAHDLQTALVSAAGLVWVTVAPAPPPPPVTGGTAHFTMQDDFSSLDPALAQVPSTEVMYATCANLVTYPDKPASAGSQIVPEVAETVPTPTDGGRTYTFTIRSGFRFSPSSNEAVTAQTFKATIERVASPQLNSPFASQFSGVVGYHDYVTGKAPVLSGVVARGSTLTITLSQPDGSFLANLAGGAACAVPSGTPAVPGGLNDIPSAGPYYIASYTPRQQLVLRRNPNYRGDRPRHLDQMIFTIGIDSARALAEIEAGTADYAVDGLPRDAGPGLESQYGPGSKAARAGHQQYFISPANGIRILHMNTSRPLFSNVRLRRAVNYAIDRLALAAQGQRFAEVNPFNAGSPAGDYMPPAIGGATDFHLYPLAGPDLRRARQLAGNVHATAIMYTPDVPPWLQEAQIIRRDLQALGIDVQLKEFPLNDFYDRISRRGEPFDLAVSVRAVHRRSGRHCVPRPAGPHPGHRADSHRPWLRPAHPSHAGRRTPES